jgi:selenocysteine-specific elongation factor
MPLVIGTAGHIDHGKTALVRALTGQDTDRLKEERERGISIDLGFAHFEAPDGRPVGIVDVPGHERFIRNMLAGAHGMDLVLFTVAADDGVMPQTEEHLDILHLLGVRRGIFVITKADLVDAPRLDAVREEIEILALGSSLEGAPVVVVSAQTGTGLPALREEMARALGHEDPSPEQGPFRMPVDRAFVVRGHGVVVTGTAMSGGVREGDSLRLLPAGTLARVRAVEAHGTPVERGAGHQRLALNLAGLERTQVGRGDVACDPAIDRVTHRFDAWVEVRPGRPRLESHRRVRVHVGTAEVFGRVVLLGGRDRLSGGEAGWAQLVVRDPVQVLRGDRFVLRDETARRTVGGGEVVYPFAGRHTRTDPAIPALLGPLRSADVGQAGHALLRVETEFATDPALAAQALAVDERALVAALQERPDVVAISIEGTPLAFTTLEKARRFEALVEAAVADAHRRDPLAPGIDLETLRACLPWPIPARLFRWGVEGLVARGRLARHENLVRAPGHRVELHAQRARLAGRVEALLAEGGLTPLDLEALAASLEEPCEEVTAVVRVLEREGRVVRVAPDLYYHPQAVQEGAERLRAHCREHGEITAAAFRDLIGASRKFSIAFLDWCDRTGVTVRVGDVRKLRR